MINKGTWYAIGTYVLWGVLPIYWKQLHNIPAVEMIGHRIVWSFLAVSLVLVVQKDLGKLMKVVSKPGVLLPYAAASLLIGINWLIYIWAVNANFIVETSLGYFINPLFSVLMGVILLKERLRSWQWLPIILAASGVIYITLAYGQLPWIALGLALSFGLYGLVKKTAPLNSLYGLTLETGFLFLPAFVYLLILQSIGKSAFLHTGVQTDLLVVLSGIVTAIPLLLFAAAAQKIPLSLVGILQYIAPTLQFLIGVFLYHEAFSQIQLVGFGMVWMALIFFALEGYLNSKRMTEMAN